MVAISQSRMGEDRLPVLRSLRSGLKPRVGLPLAGARIPPVPRAASGLREKCPRRTRALLTTRSRLAAASSGSIVFRESLRLGYKFHHLSNLYTAPDNP